MKPPAALAGLDPLRELLGDVLSRLEALEATVGKAGTISKGAASTRNLLGPSSHTHASTQPAKIASCKYR